MSLERLRGFRDVYPEEMEIRDQVFDKIKAVVRSFGFKQIDIPSLEPLDLYRIKSGDELLGQTFNFSDRSGREVTLLPEATPSVVRMLTSRKDIPKPVRWFCLPKIWRYEEPQSGRLREHIQLNADIFGSSSEAADAEVIGLACTILDTLGLSGHYEIRLNDRVLMDGILSHLGVPDTRRAFAAIDRFHKVSSDEFIIMLKNAGMDDEAAHRVLKLSGVRSSPSEASEILDDLSLQSDAVKERLERIKQIAALVSKYSDARVVLDLSIVRGLSYYTGLVFEAFDVKGELRAILGGGRYDSLASVIGEQQIPAVGFGMGDVVLELLMRRAGSWRVQENVDSYYICTVNNKLLGKSLQIARSLRSNGYRVTVDLADRNISNQLRMAASSGSRYSIILGEKEIETGFVSVRDMNTGEQRAIPLDQMIN
ncbi:MAG: histidine--tRNA ligase [Thermoplasmataceae archaeon]